MFNQWLKQAPLHLFWPPFTRCTYIHTQNFDIRMLSDEGAHNELTNSKYNLSSASSPADFMGDITWHLVEYLYTLCPCPYSENLYLPPLVPTFGNVSEQIYSLRLEGETSFNFSKLVSVCSTKLKIIWLWKIFHTDSFTDLANQTNHRSLPCPICLLEITQLYRKEQQTFSIKD